MCTVVNRLVYRVGVIHLAAVASKTFTPGVPQRRSLCLSSSLIPVTTDQKRNMCDSTVPLVDKLDTHTSTDSQPESGKKKPFERLPKYVKPIHYNITLTPDLSKLTFSGYETIDIQVREPTDHIILNSNKLDINNQKSNVKVGNNVYFVKEVHFLTEDERIKLLFEETLPPGRGQLMLTFSGTMSDTMRGMYPSRYIGPDGQERVTAVTQFQASDARRLFPCWDEPAHKATFTITLVVPDDKKLKVLSNMPVCKEKIDKLKRRTVTFQKTPIMSTYLVAMAIGEFDYIETKSKFDVTIRVYTPVGKAELGRFALDVAARSLDFFCSYFQIAYPLGKLDLLAVSDFAAGAMENWGLVTYRETCLLVDPEHTSAIRKQNISLTVAHELAHQWFGNLVTMQWWTHLWLNEGFATFMQYLCVNDIFPEFDIWTQFASDVFLDAMELDALDNSHPIEVVVDHPDEIDQIFDDISYSKGACVIRMLYSYIGDKEFREGMKSYLTKFSYGNAVTEDLWDSLEQASNKPIRRMMTTWTKQKGYPLINADLNGDRLALSQKKFNINGKLSPEDEKMIWAIPILVTAAASPDKPIIEQLMEGRKSELNLPATVGNDWIKLNPMAKATYRVVYDDECLGRLLNGVATEQLGPVDRLNLIDDLFAITLAGKINSVNLLRAVESFRQETHYVVWSVLSNILGKYHQLLYGSDVVEKFIDYGRELVMTRAFPAVGWEPKPGEQHLQTLLRSLLVNRLVAFEHPDIMAKCRDAWEKHVAKTALIPADLRAGVYRSMARQCDEDVWETFMKLYAETELQEEKNRLASSLGAVQNPEFTDRVLEFAISDKVRPQDTVFVVGSVATNPVSRKRAWMFFQEHKDLFKSRYENSFLGTSLVKCLTENFQTTAEANEVENYFRENPFAGWERAIQQSVETIRLNASVIDRDRKLLTEFLRARSG